VVSQSYSPPTAGSGAALDSAASEGGDSVIVMGSAILYGEGPCPHR